jgi:putative ABC transport system permease protein
MEGDVTWVGLALSLVAVAVAAAISYALGLRLERDVLGSSVRALAQLLIAGVALGVVIDKDSPLALSWLWVAGIVVFAGVTVWRRVPELPGILPVAIGANAVTTAVGLGIAFGTGMFPVEGRTIVPIAGMVVGNAMKAGVVAAQRLRDEVAGRRDEIEARLALGLPSSEAAKPLSRGVLRTAISPQIENTRALGIVFLPGAMTGLILAGVDPLDAVLVQLALMYLILGAVVVTATLLVLGVRRRVFTADHRLLPLARAVRDEG